MSNKLLTAMRHYQLPQDIGQRTATRCLLYALADRADDNRFSCFPSVGTLANDSHMSSRGVQRCLKQLVNLGLVSITRRNNSSSIYTLNMRLLQGQLDAQNDSAVPISQLSPEFQLMWKTIHQYCTKTKLHLPLLPSQQDLSAMQHALVFEHELESPRYLMQFFEFIHEELGEATNIANPLVRFHRAYENHPDAECRFGYKWGFFLDSINL